MLIPLLLTLLIFAWMGQAILSVLQVRKFASLYHHRSKPSDEVVHPPAAVIVPFKGVDEDLADNLRSLIEQKYPSYRLLWVVESQDDPAYAVLHRAMTDNPDRPIDLLVAGAASAHEGQKIHNQLFAIEHLTCDDEVWVFADSDAAPGRDWLANLVAPLAEPKVGMTTGYRWLVPVGGRSLASLVASVINGAVACAFRKGDWGQAWGGAMALYARTARQGDLLSHLRGALTDDYQFSRMCRSLGKRVLFVPRALSPTPVDFTWRSFMDFGFRQYLITRIYVPRLYLAALGITTLYMIGTIAVWGVFFVAITKQPIDWLGACTALAIATVFVAHQLRTFYRRRVVLGAFGPDMLQKLAPALRLEQWGTTLYMAVHWWIVLRAGFSRTMTWRSIRYRLDGRQNVTRLSD